VIPVALAASDLDTTYCDGESGGAKPEQTAAGQGMGEPQRMSLRERIAAIPGVRSAYHRLRPTGGRNPTLRASDYHRPILSQEAGNELIGQAILDGKPFLAGRLGTVELDAICHYLRHRGESRPKDYPASVAMAMGNNAGFFPVTTENLDRFAVEYLAAAAALDADAVWFNPGENLVAREVCPEAALVPLRSLEPYYHERPWSRTLAGKRVLVVHPFADSIVDNYRSKRSLLFRDPDVLSEFDLVVLRAVQSIAGESTEFGTWFDALDSMKGRIGETAFDVLIVGAGAYGLPLAAHAKRLGKVAIHMGGATQILFGIRGRRWDDHEFISSLFNEHWTRPKPSETPSHFERVEDGGAYW
jgi:hypothetical protein